MSTAKVISRLLIAKRNAVRQPSSPRDACSASRGRERDEDKTRQAGTNEYIVVKVDDAHEVTRVRRRRGTMQM
ncbi:hypothetical protein LY78DRAFT_663498 [Colletotrichum sublineola]|nr:hypothetical protein LY78DRAFT_663498 [Colletotrichum sublineola]